ncbi:MAG: hypothetical protein LC121_25475 [Anaerolineae bacterium]|nr:hypothetical protein [Anaerolineae bacterium]
MSAPEPEKQPDPAAEGKKAILSWKSALSALLAWVVIDMALHFLLTERLHIGTQMYLGLGFYVLHVKKICLPVRFEAFDVAGWFRAFYWAAWWPWYLVRRSQ